MRLTSVFDIQSIAIYTFHRTHEPKLDFWQIICMKNMKLSNVTIGHAYQKLQIWIKFGSGLTQT